MDCLRGVAFGPLAILTNIQQNSFWIFSEPVARLLDREFFDLRPGFVDQFEKSGRVLHISDPIQICLTSAAGQAVSAWSICSHPAHKRCTKKNIADENREERFPRAERKVLPSEEQIQKEPHHER